MKDAFFPRANQPRAGMMGRVQPRLNSWENGFVFPDHLLKPLSSPTPQDGRWQIAAIAARGADIGEESPDVMGVVGRIRQDHFEPTEHAEFGKYQVGIDV